MEAIHIEKLSNFVKLLLAKIGSIELLDNFRKSKLDFSLLTKLERRLTRIVVLLNDDVDLNEWFDMVSHAVFELEWFDKLYGLKSLRTFLALPSLKTLLLSKCPKLIVGNIADKFPSLSELELRECPLLVQSMPLSDLAFRQLMFPLNSLQQLTIDGIPSSMSFPTDGLPKTLKFLIISNCENLEFLPREYLSNYTSLEELKISYSCNSMTLFTLGALPVLKSLFIESCKNLKSIVIAGSDCWLC